MSSDCDHLLDANIWKEIHDRKIQTNGYVYAKGWVRRWRLYHAIKISHRTITYLADNLFVYYLYSVKELVNVKMTTEITHSSLFTFTGLQKMHQK